MKLLLSDSEFDPEFNDYIKTVDNSGSGIALPVEPTVPVLYRR